MLSDGWHHDCEYCGSRLTADECNVTDGTRHFTAQCREYVHAALRSYKRENAGLRAELSKERTSTSIPWSITQSWTSW